MNDTQPILKENESEQEDTNEEVPPVVDNPSDDGEDIDMEGGLQDVLDAVNFLVKYQDVLEPEKKSSTPAARPKPSGSGTLSSTRAPAKPGDGQTSLEDMAGAVWTSRAGTAAPAAGEGGGKTTHQTTLDAYCKLDEQIKGLEEQLTPIPLPKPPSPQIPSHPKGPGIEGAVTYPDSKGKGRPVATPLARQLTFQAGLTSLMVYLWNISYIDIVVYMYTCIFRNICIYTIYIMM